MYVPMGTGHEGVVLQGHAGQLQIFMFFVIESSPGVSHAQFTGLLVLFQV